MKAIIKFENFFKKGTLLTGEYTNEFKTEFISNFVNYKQNSDYQDGILFYEGMKLNGKEIVYPNKKFVEESEEYTLEGEINEAIMGLSLSENNILNDSLNNLAMLLQQTNIAYESIPNLDKLIKLAENELEKNMLYTNVEVKLSSNIVTKERFIVDNEDKKGLYQLIPEMDKNYIESNDLLSLYNTFEMVLDKGVDINNVLLKGPAGTGKSSMVKELAARLNMPYVIVSATPDMTTEDMFGYLTPMNDSDTFLEISNFEEQKSDLREKYGLWNVSDDTLLNFMLHEKEMAVSNKSIKFKETNFLKAIKHGGIVEIQEPTIIRNPAVLAGLNSLLEEGIVTIDTKNVVKRNSKCIIFMTTNIGYEGCRNMNQSVIDRMDITKELKIPIKERLIDIVMKKSGYEDKEQLSKMIDVTNNIMKFCSEEGISDGEVGLRSLISWAKLLNLPHYDMEASFVDGLLLKATNDEDDRMTIKKIFENSSLY